MNLDVITEEKKEKKTLEKSGKKVGIGDFEFIDPLKVFEGIDDDRESIQIYNRDCHCPCPKVSAPVYAAGYVCFSPIF